MQGGARARTEIWHKCKKISALCLLESGFAVRRRNMASRNDKLSQIALSNFNAIWESLSNKKEVQAT